MHMCIHMCVWYVHMCALHISLAVAILDNDVDILQNIGIVEKQKVLCCAVYLCMYVHTRIINNLREVGAYNMVYIYMYIHTFMCT